MSNWNDYFPNCNCQYSSSSFERVFFIIFYFLQCLTLFVIITFCGAVQLTLVTLWFSTVVCCAVEMQFSDGIFCSFSLSLLSPIAEVQLCQYTCWVILLLLSVMTAAAACRNSFSPFIIFFSTVCPSFVSHSLSQSVSQSAISSVPNYCQYCRSLPLMLLLKSAWVHCMPSS